MEVVPCFERRLFSPSSQYSMSNTPHPNDSTKKELDAGGLQLPSWQIDHNRYYCSQNTPSHCSHRYTASPSGNSLEMQSHSSGAWHPFGYDTTDAYLTSRTTDGVGAYHGIDPRLAASRSPYPIASNTQANTTPHAYGTLSNTFHRQVKGAENAYQSQHSQYHRLNGAYSESFMENKKEWELAFMRGMPYSKSHVNLLLYLFVYGSANMTM